MSRMSSNSNSLMIHRQVSKIDLPNIRIGIFGTSSNLINAIVGAGIIGIPYSIKQCGLLFGIILILLVGYLTRKSLNMIVEIATYHPKCRHLGVLTYEDLMSIPYGKIGYNFILINMFILAYGAMIAYLLIIKDTVPTLLGLGNTYIEREGIMFITSLLIMVPLSMLRDISQLSFTSFISIIADGVLVILIVLYSPYKTTINDAGGIGTVLHDNLIHTNIFVGLGVISTAMACQHSAFLLSGTLSNHTSIRWNIVTSISLLIATMMSLLLGVFGYLGFLNNTQGDILLNFENTNILNIGRILLAITMFFTYPMEAFVARHVWIQLRYNGNMDNTTIGSDGVTIIPESKMCYCCFGRRQQITLLLYVMTLIPALMLRDLGPVLSITGSLGASCISYIAPGLIYIGINGTDFCTWIGDKVKYKKIASSSRQEQQQSITSTASEVELPVVGDITATMQTAADHDDMDIHHISASSSTQNNYVDETSSSSLSSYKKPWWWYITGMLIWFYIAHLGNNGTNQFLHNLEENDDDTNRMSHINNNHHDNENNMMNDEDTNDQNEASHVVPLDDDDDENINQHDDNHHHHHDSVIPNDDEQQQHQEMIGPCHHDYMFSIFFIIFGTIAAVAGVISNIWIQMNNVYNYYNT